MSTLIVVNTLSNVLLVLVISLALAIQCLHELRKRRRTPPTPVVTEGVRHSAPDGTPIHPLEEAMRHAFGEAGLNIDDYDEDFDVAATGKLNEVMHYAAQRYGVSHPTKTVADIKRVIEALL